MRGQTVQTKAKDSKEKLMQKEEDLPHDFPFIIAKIAPSPFLARTSCLFSDLLRGRFRRAEIKDAGKKPL